MENDLLCLSPLQNDARISKHLDLIITAKGHSALMIGWGTDNEEENAFMYNDVTIEK